MRRVAGGFQGRLGHQRPDRTVGVLAAVFAHAGWVSLDVAGTGHGVAQGRVQQAQQTGLPVGQLFARAGHGLQLAWHRRHARQHRPGLGDQVDAGLRIGVAAQGLAVVKEGPCIPLAVPSRALQRGLPALGRQQPALGPCVVAAAVGQGRHAGHQGA